MQLETIKQMWDSYATKLLAPLGVSETQYTETRRGFYAGAFVMLTAIQQLGDESISEERGIGYLEARKAELLRFYEEVKAGRA